MTKSLMNQKKKIELGCFNGLWHQLQTVQK